MKTLGTYLAEQLDAYGIEFIFGIPGVHTVELYRGMPNTKLRHITPRHEQGAGFMADGYARVTGKPAVALVITGPGLTNIATAMAQAYADSIPMLVISSVNALGKMNSGNGHLHELKNQQRLAEGLAAWSHTVFTAADLDQALARAFALFESARPRPIHIEIPTDIITTDVSAHQAPKPVRRPLRPAPRSESIDEAAEWLTSAHKPLILAGAGAINAAASLRILAEKLDAPLMMTLNARGILSGDHPLAVPCNPSLAACRALMEEADVILAIGTEFGPTDYDWYETGHAQIHGKLIRVDIDPEQAMRGHIADCVIIADADATAKALIMALRREAHHNGQERAKTTRGRVMREDVPPIYRASLSLLDTVRDTLPNAVIVGDSAQPVYAASVAYAATDVRRLFSSATGFGTLGYAMPAAVGAKLANPSAPVIAVIGDGGYLFSSAELSSALEAKTPIIILLWNNHGYGEIKTFMISKQIAPIGVDIVTPDFIALAKAHGAEALKLSHADDLPQELKNAASRRIPTLIEIDETDFVRARG